MLFQSAALAAFAGVAASAAVAGRDASSVGQHQDGGIIYGGRPAYYPYPDGDDDGDDCPPQTPVISTHSQTPAPSTTAASATSNAPAQPSWATAYTATDTAFIAAAAATALTSSGTSNVKGKAFRNVMMIMFENTDYETALANPDFGFYAKNGVTLNNSHAHTHPSEPNYMTMVVGDYFGCDNDDMSFIHENVSSIVDLLEDGGVSWAYYMEDLPFSGDEAFDYTSPVNGLIPYTRKHDPGILANSITESEQRLSLIKNISFIDPSSSMFHKDLANNQMAQYIWVTPNMTSDAHDSNITVAGTWLRNFLDGLVLTNKDYMEETVIYITFDENASLSKQNKILSILYGPAIPKKYVGTVDNNFYSHYSALASIEANWDLFTLGRHDVGANCWQFVADQTGDKIREWDFSLGPFPLFNDSYSGPFNSGNGNKQYPAPNLDIVTSTGRTVSPRVKKIWADSKQPTYYTDALNLPTGQFPPKGWEPVPADN